MIRGARKQLGNALWTLAIVALGLLVGGYLASQQRLTVPDWVPIAGQERFELEARLQTAAGVLPGQGAAVTIAGVKVGEIAGVRLDRGQAVLRLRIEPRHARIHRDATLLLRPKTSLKDMVVQLDPGRRGPLLEDGETLGIEATRPDVNLDEILASLDGDTRAALQLLIGDAGTALGDGNGRRLGAALKRFEPLSRHAAKASRLVAQRRVKLKRLMGNLSRLADELGSRDRQLATFVNSSAAVFRRFAAQSGRLGEAVELLPDTLRVSDGALVKLTRLGDTLEAGLAQLRPAARALGPTLDATRPFLRTTTPVIRRQLRPFAREAQPTARRLVPTARRLADATPNLRTLTDVLNAIVDELAHDPPGDGPTGQGYLFHVPWASHNTNSVLASQDGVGPLRRGVVLMSCGSMQLLESLASPRRNPTLSTLIQLLASPDYRQQIAQKSCPYTPPPRLARLSRELPR